MQLKSKKLWVALVTACAILPGGAALADRPHSWTGFYAGLHAGGGETKWSSAADDADGSLKKSGAAGGVHLGYNFATQGMIIGIEGDLSASRARAEETTDTITARLANSYLGSVRARLGFLASPDLLVYATGGLAFTNTKLSVTDADLGLSASVSGRANGWVLGGGLEWKMSRAVSLRGEALHYDFSGVDLRFDGASLGKIDSSATVVRAGVSLHFN
jgi:outer membrane immunogenic protein